MGYELPEILKLTGQMQKALVGKTITSIIVEPRCSSLIKQGMCNLDQRNTEVFGSQIAVVCGNGKWIYWQLSNGLFVIFGEMIGKFEYAHDHTLIEPNYHFAFLFQNGDALGFYSSLYAFAQIVNEEQLRAHKYAGQVGITPLDKDFTPAYLAEMAMRYANKPVKALLNMQAELSGLGNVYINDILYQAWLHPLKKAGMLSAPEKDLLYKSIRQVIDQAIEQGGSADEIDLNGKNGRYVRVMSKTVEGKPCTRCGATIVKSNVLGSASYFCPKCQKE